MPHRILPTIVVAFVVREVFRDPLVNSGHSELAPFPESVLNELRVGEWWLLGPVAPRRREVPVVDCRVTLARLLVRATLAVTPSDIAHTNSGGQCEFKLFGESNASSATFKNPSIQLSFIQLRTVMIVLGRRHSGFIIGSLDEGVQFEVQ